MKIIYAKDYSDLSRKAANIISAQVILKPNSVLGLATGSTPIGTYKQLIEWYEKGDIDFSVARSVNLDEYVGINSDNEQSYRYFMDTHLFSHINIKRENTYVPSGKAVDLQEECKAYDDLIQKVGGIDMQLLGIGHNGHIGFNEPDQAFEKTTHIVELGDTTISANARFFDSIEEVPRKAITMGIKSIMQAQKILLIANGKDKEEIINKALNGPVTPAIPASILQLHPDLTVICSFES
ncbi:glucosamine-6-phosphate deaminase [Anaerosporobacter mobilis DSM 15930]|jgi:glucosamine-6-phosphate deaminase|uniref:Glucosamine-6-phosphate deaminase n=1 Tax=Anaerosporobacter mobilis DSM 15930 TaxID=1120996 RepID=A0A1M7JHB1_9FIRM|nr:glucosamine-6-phosphate deaminase [Anaerosporobacter mobilis]SHM52183.1 glucosamine-6-phosphate deaminase [Anaerosporobacter mobilis DSM 15930]